MSSKPTAALVINHIGITVPDIQAAIDWYADVFGFHCIMGPRVLEADSHADAASVFGRRFRRAWQAHLLTGNSVGIELFQFLDPPVREQQSLHEDALWLDRGPWHLCVTHPNVEALVDRIVEHGGTLVASPRHFLPGRPWVLAYTTDPWGTVLEVLSHSYAEAFSNWPQPGQLTPPTLVPHAQTDPGEHEGR